MFHLTIEATARVEGFSWLMIASYGLFLVRQGPALRRTIARIERTWGRVG